MYSAAPQPAWLCIHSLKLSSREIRLRCRVPAAPFARAMELSEVTLRTDCKAEALKRIAEHKPFIFAWDGKCEIAVGELVH